MITSGMELPAILVEEEEYIMMEYAAVLKVDIGMEFNVLIQIKINVQASTTLTGMEPIVFVCQDLVL